MLLNMMVTNSWVIVIVTFHVSLDFAYAPRLKTSVAGSANKSPVIRFKESSSTDSVDPLVEALDSVVSSLDADSIENDHDDAYSDSEVSRSCFGAITCLSCLVSGCLDSFLTSGQDSYSDDHGYTEIFGEVLISSVDPRDRPIPSTGHRHRAAACMI
jgi:hypothetical protein